MSFASVMSERMPSTMALPDEFAALFKWMEMNGFLMPSRAYPDDSLGLLGSPDKLGAGTLTAILFRVATPEQARDEARAWIGDAVPDIENRLVPFARTGGDGSHVAFWLDDHGNRKVVHLGSEGLVCLLGDTALDFLRLLAIGYGEISGDCLDAPALPPSTADRNRDYRAWLAERYGVTIPSTAAEIIGSVPDAAAETSSDPFWQWMRAAQERRDAQAT